MLVLGTLAIFIIFIINLEAITATFSKNLFFVVIVVNFLLTVKGPFYLRDININCHHLITNPVIEVLLCCMRS